MAWKTSAAQRRHYAYRRMAGLCARCPRPSLKYSRCLACRTRERAPKMELKAA